MSNEAFSKLWHSFLAEENIPRSIEKHKRERARLLSRVERSVREHLEGSKSGESVRVLEIGCGTAIDSYLIAASFLDQPVEVVATDVSAEALELAEQIGAHFPAGIRLQVADAFALDFPDAHFDVVFSQGVLEHFSDPLPALREQARVAKPDGEIVVDLPQKYNLYTLYKRPRVRRGVWRYGWETEYSPRELRALGRRAGLECVDSFGYGSGLELSDRFPVVRAGVRLYNGLTRLIASVLPVSDWLLLNLVVVFRRR